VNLPLRAATTLVLLTASCAAPDVTAPPTPTVTSTPTSAVITALPSPTPRASSAPAAAGRPGLISRIDNQPIVIRAETDVTPIRGVPSFKVAFDGSRLTYWTENAGRAVLHVFEANGDDRIIATFPQRPGGVAWSTDGTGLLVSLDDSGDPRYLIARVVIAVDIASGASSEVYRGIGPSGASVVPLVWQRSSEIFAVYETGPGGYSFGYTVIRPGQAPVRTDPDSDVVGMAASSDGAFIVGQWIREGPGVLKTWPVDDFSKKTALRLAADEYVGRPQWWPDRPEIAFAAGRLTDGMWRDVRIERWHPATGVRTVLKRLPDRDQLGAYLIRADGSGLLTQGPYPPGAWEVTDLRTGVTSPIPQLPGEVIQGTVLLR
jgi:hypothetical protein